MKHEIIGFLQPLVLSALAFIAPVQSLMIAIGVLIFIDFVLGNITAYKAGIPIQSKEWKRTLIKMVLYQIAVLTGFILDIYFIPGNIIVRVCGMAIGLIEGKSIFEHIYALTGLNIWALLKDRLQTSVSSNTKSTLSTISTSSDGTVTTTTKDSTKSVVVPPKDPE